eukprot:g2283.t1
MTRDELIEGLFHALDADHGATGALEAASVRIFAEATGFEGTDEQWQEQLEAMYSFFGWETGEAISNTQFAELVNNDEDTTDDELREVLTFAERTGFDGDDLEWEERFTHMLEDFGWSAEGISKEDFAQFLGDEDDEVEWEEQLEAMQQFFRWAPGQGLSAEEFAQLVDHDEDTTEEELREVLARLQRRDLRKSEQRRSQRRSERRFSVRSWGRKSFVKSEEELRRLSRVELISRIFTTLNRQEGIQQSQSLSQEGFRRFAELTGFEGSDLEWEQQFTGICKLYGWNPQKEISLPLCL